MVELLEIHTTTGSLEEAERIADHLLQSRLAACVQVSGPVTSHYWWQGQLERSSEWLCTAKTTASLYDRIEAAVRQVHSYDEPQILAVPIVRVSTSYQLWVRAQVVAE